MSKGVLALCCVGTILCGVVHGCGGDEFSGGNNVAGAGGSNQPETGAGSGGSSKGGSAGSSTGGSSGAATGGSAGTTAAGAAGNAGAPAENCWDGKDNNGDGKTDCDDPICVAHGFVCVPAGPMNPSFVWLVATDDTCPSQDTEKLLWASSDLIASPANCSLACDVQCTAQVRCSSDGSCTNTTLVTPNGVAEGACVNSTTGYGSGVFSCTATAQGTSCAAKLGNVDKAPFSWDASKKACVSTTGGTCGGSNSVCVPKPPAAASPCIFGNATEQCPTAYPNKTVFFDGTSVNDNRTCTVSNGQCSIPSTALPDCSGALAVFCPGGLGCNGTKVGSINAGGVCSNPIPACSPPLFKIEGPLTAISTDGCQLSGTTIPIGDVTPTQPIAVCCQ